MKDDWRPLLWNPAIQSRADFEKQHRKLRKRTHAYCDGNGWVVCRENSNEVACVICGTRGAFHVMCAPI